MSETSNEPQTHAPQMIEGRYRIVRNIAEGGMATVYEAVDERLGRTVAIKVMHTQLAKGPHRDQFVERFRREANSAAAIANPHIVQVYDTGEYNGLDFLVMEYVHGVNLRHEMNVQGTFSVRETLRVIAETLDGLSSAHRAGVVHRDIKPENILINDRGHVQITDFGLAKAASQATLSSTGMLLGTAAYLAPEMIEHNQATAQGDLYSVGIMAWEMLAGKVPFDSDNPVTLVFKHVHEDVPSLQTVCPGIDPVVAGFIAHLTARAVDARPADGAEAADELRRVAAKLSQEAWQYRKLEIAESSKPDDLTVPALVGVIGASNAPRVVGEHQPSAEPSHSDTSSQQPTQPPVPPVAPTAVFDASKLSNANGANADSDFTQMLPNVPNDAQTQALNQNQDAFTQALTLDGSPIEPEIVDAGNGPKSKRRKKVTIIVITIVITALIATIGGTGWWWYYRGPGSYWNVPQPQDITCTEGTNCSLAGADWATYESTLKVAGIPYTTVEDNSDIIDEGKVISATVDDKAVYVDSRIGKRSGQQLTITISKGVKSATIPSNILDSATPLDDLKNAGFDNIKHDDSTDQYSMDKAEGTLLSISPDPGTTLKHNDEVTVSLSKGLMPVTMPNIVGKTQDEMQASFDELKLTANVTEQFDDKIPAGEVISASQDAGAQLKWGDSVDVVVSKGPETTVMPNVVGKQYDEAAKQLEALGFTVKKSAPLGDLTHQVRIQSPKAGETVRLRDENGTPTVITLTVV
ncbi:Stk1 family PASTA domain-containing Ser/Thr kinase [Bifidobacterium oedipodis]|uniref:non-specific serine/threonine protein kinase n=1 Tax=Bifidobacterium oedipodis TaxID=2675322 RepID=A0A7Y0HRN9_9BIFI|nr:Stk1 family PASTA domain-containing Ser/Thr kinase [Bifidobacterium sp. DSM 109957]NMM93091.1 serine/threonine protein kinase [Bifidobacterium sp. DSM 109957]